MQMEFKPSGCCKSMMPLLLLLCLLGLLGMQPVVGQVEPRVISRINSEIASRGRSSTVLDSELLQINAATGPISIKRNATLQGGGSGANSILVDQFGVATTAVPDNLQGTRLREIALSPEFPARLVDEAVLTRLLGQYASVWGGRFTVVQCVAPYSAAIEIEPNPTTIISAADPDGDDLIATEVTISNLLIVDCQGPAVKVMPGDGNLVVNLVNVVFFNNTNLGVDDESGGNGGGIYVENINDGVALEGPFMTAVPANVRLEKCVFLSNRAAQGSAIFLGPGNNQLSLSRSIFHANSQDAGTTGTAVYGSAVFANLSQVPAISECTFVGNGFAPRKWPNTNIAISTVQSPVIRGGAVYLEEPFRSVVMVDSVFVNNSARQGGGAVAVRNQVRPYTMSITNCRFQQNWAGGETSQGENEGAGGALWLRETFAITLQDNTWFKNYGARSGGAVWSSLAAITTAVRDQFINNWVNAGEGGGWYAVKDGQVTWQDCTFRDNMASAGGGVACSRDVACNAQGSTFVNNNVTTLGGAIECAGCLSLSLSGCDITSNRAGSAGGVSLVPISLGTVSNTTFFNNTAAVGGSGITCSRDAQGAAGGLCVGGSPENPVSVSDTRFINNYASNGGAVLSDNTCLNEGCTNLQLFDLSAEATGSMFVGNKAPTGGGGALWMREPDTVALVCSASDSTIASSPIPTACPAWTQPNLGNQAAYGNVIASSAASLALDAGVFNESNNYLSSGVFEQVLPAMVYVKDAYGEVITKGSSEATPTLLVSADNSTQIRPTLSGDTFVTAINGTVRFKTLRLFAPPGTYNLTFTQNGLVGEVEPITLPVTVRPCRVGEIPNTKDGGPGDQCNACVGNFFSFNPSNNECEVCPENARCDFQGKEVGSILVPDKGYWHSSPLSGQIFQCPSKAACSGSQIDPNSLTDQRFMDLAAFQKALALQPNLLNISRDREALNVSGYMRLLCLEGHEGNLCAGCSDGFGRQGNGKCARCPDTGANTTFFIVAVAVLAFILSLTITTQLEAHDDELLETNTRTSGHMSSPPLPRGARESDAYKPPGIDVQDRALSGVPSLVGTPTGPVTPKVPTSTRMDGGDKADSTRVVVAVAEGAHPEADTPTAGHAGHTKIDSKRTSFRSLRFRMPSFHWAKAPGRSTFVRNLMIRQKTRGRLALKDDGLTRTFQSHSAVIKILVNYLQVVSIVRTVSLEWPGPVSAFFTAANQASATVGTFVSLDCSLVANRVPKSIQAVIVMCAVPLVIIAASIPVWSVLWWFGHRHSIIWGSYRTYLSNRFMITALATVFFFYPTVTTQLLSVFSCPELDVASRPTGENALAVGRFWAADYTVECFQGQHLVLMLALAIPGTILFCVGVPLGSALFLWLNRQRLRDVEFTRTFAFIYADYKDEFFYWESVVLLRKFLLILVVVFGMKAGLTAQLLLSLGIIVLGSFVATVMQPYRMSRLDYLDRLSQWFNSLAVYLALYLAIDDVSSLARQTVSILLVITGTAIIVYLLLQIAKEFIWVQMRMIDHDSDGLLSRHDITDFLASKQGEAKINRIYAHTLSWALEFVSKSQWRKRYLSYFFIFPSEHLLDVPSAPPPRAGTTYHMPTLTEDVYESPASAATGGQAGQGQGQGTNGATREPEPYLPVAPPGLKEV